MMGQVYITEKITYHLFKQKKHNRSILRDERTLKSSLIIGNLQSTTKGSQIMEKETSTTRTL